MTCWGAFTSIRSSPRRSRNSTRPPSTPRDFDACTCHDLNAGLFEPRQQRVDQSEGPVPLRVKAVSGRGVFRIEIALFGVGDACAHARGFHEIGDAGFVVESDPVERKDLGDDRIEIRGRHAVELFQDRRDDMLRNLLSEALREERVKRRRGFFCIAEGEAEIGDAFVPDRVRQRPQIRVVAFALQPSLEEDAGNVAVPTRHDDPFIMPLQVEHEIVEVGEVRRREGVHAMVETAELPAIEAAQQSARLGAALDDEDRSGHFCARKQAAGDQA